MQTTYLKFSQTIGIFLLILLFVSCSKSGSNPTPVPKTPDPVLAITSLNVTIGSYNTSVIITGTKFSATATDDQVFFNGKAATVTAATSTQITATVPLGAGSGPVTLSVSNGTPVTGPVFTYKLSAFITTFAGNGNPATVDGVGTRASLHGPVYIAIDGSNNIFASDPYNNSIRKITPDGTVSTFAGGQLGFADGKGSAAAFNDPAGIAIDGAGNLYVADIANQEIRKITPDGTVGTFAGQLYAKGATDGQGTAAKFSSPEGITIDQSGNLYVTEATGNLIRKITPGGLVSTIAGNANNVNIDGKGILASFRNPNNIVIDHSGNIYVANDYSDNVQSEIRKIATDTTVTTIIPHGGVGVNYSGLAIDNSGVLYVSMPGDGEIQTFSATGVLSVFAGGNLGGSVLGPNNTPISLNPFGMVFDKAGTMFYADFRNNLILKVRMQ